jgi:fluoroacetyl-CoA thioesterase
LREAQLPAPAEGPEVTPGLQAGLQGTFRYRVPESKSVPRIHPEAPDFQMMPAVLATGYLVALCEWACIELIKPHLDWPREQSLGTHVSLSHLAATPPGFEVEIQVRLTAVEGRKLTFAVSAHDGTDQITEGTHERHTIDAERFAARVAAKAAAGEAA